MKYDFLNKRTISVCKRQIRLADIAFVAVFAVIAALFFLNAHVGITECDESLYQLSCFRLSLGDKLLADDWIFTNLSSFFLYLPYRFFTALLGGTEGLILALRYLYICIKLILFCYIYVSLRSYGWWSILAGAIYVGMDFFGVKTTSYYSICANAVLLAAMIVFVKKDLKKRHFIFAGFLFSCAVIAQPFSAFIWIVYSLTVFFVSNRKKKNKPVLGDYAFILSFQPWLYITAGVLIAAAVFLILCLSVFTGHDLKLIFTGIGQMFRFLNLEVGNGLSTVHIRFIDKPEMYVKMYNPVLVCLFFLVYFIGVVLHRYTKRKEKLWFSLLAVLFAALSVHLILFPVERLGAAVGESSSNPILLSLLAAAAYTFTEKKDRKLFAFLLLSFFVSFAVDCTSTNTFGSLLLPGAVPAVILIRHYFQEKRNEKTVRKNRSRQRIFLGVLCALVVFISSFEVWHYVYMAGLHETEALFCHLQEPLDTELTSGTLKGIVTTKTLSDNYNKCMRDIALIRSRSAGNLYVADYDSSVYLNAGMPVAAPTAHVSNRFDIEEAWWEEHPERRPDIVYVPYASLSYLPDLRFVTAEYTLAYFEERASVTVLEGEMGYIVEINGWKE